MHKGNRGNQHTEGLEDIMETVAKVWYEEYHFQLWLARTAMSIACLAELENPLSIPSDKLNLMKDGLPFLQGEYAVHVLQVWLRCSAHVAKSPASVLPYTLYSDFPINPATRYTSREYAKLR